MRRRDCGRIGSGYSGAECGGTLAAAWRWRSIPLEGREENIVFEVPKELRVDIREVD